jgi:hypothetical protein
MNPDNHLCVFPTGKWDLKYWFISIEIDALGAKNAKKKELSNHQID